MLVVYLKHLAQDLELMDYLPEPVIERLSDIKMQTDYGSSSLSQRVAAEWIKKVFMKNMLQT